MTNNPDKILIQTLKKFYQEEKECLEYVQNSDWEEYKEICEDYKAELDDLERILKEVKSIDDLAEMDEDTIGFVFECLENYISCFVISPAGSPNFESDMNEYDNVEELLGLFYDDVEDETEDQDEE